MLSKLLRRDKKSMMKSDKENRHITARSKGTNTPISEDFKTNLGKIQGLFSSDSDVNIRRFNIGKDNTEAFIVNIDNMNDPTSVNSGILDILMWELRQANINYDINLENIKNYAISSNRVKNIFTIEEAIDGVLNGNTVLFLEGEDNALEIGTQSWEHRGVQAPQIENIVRGPHEGFTETIGVNTSLVRRKIRNPDLKIEDMIIGRRTKTKICIVYLNGIVNGKIVEEVRRRLKYIDIDSILESGYIEELIEDSPWSPFPTIGITEVPDKFAAKILEGRVGILTDGTPIALTVPFLFIECFQATEDYYSSYIMASMMRLLRISAFYLTMFAPGVYISLINFHPDVIPERLLLTIAVTRETIPFPSIIEALIMSIVFLVLREAGVRMPRPVGSAVSIVGALIMGEVAVSAGLVSPIMIIVIALTGILSFILPPQLDCIVLFRFPILIFSSIFGLFSIMWSFIFMIIHITSLRSFGVPYASPGMPFNIKGMKDYIIRVPWWLMKTRPSAITWRNSQRVEDNSRPDPNKGKAGEKVK